MKARFLIWLLLPALAACVVVPARPGWNVVGPPVIVEPGFYGPVYGPGYWYGHRFGDRDGDWGRHHGGDWGRHHDGDGGGHYRHGR